VKVARGKPKWLRNVTLYSASGLLVSVLVGLATGLVGRDLAGAPTDGLMAAALGVAMLAIAREVRWRDIPVPHLRRQTRSVWAKGRGMKVGSVLWGLDLGLIFSTYVAFSGAWVLLAVAIASGQPAFAAGIFGSYWIGRALSVWIAPLWVDDPQSLWNLPNELDRRQHLFRIIHVAALGAVLIILTLWLMAGSID
jgi:hypothetical protein